MGRYKVVTGCNAQCSEHSQGHGDDCAQCQVATRLVRGPLLRLYKCLTTLLDAWNSYKIIM